jgi:hypothetical protein
MLDFLTSMGRKAATIFASLIVLSWLAGPPEPMQKRKPVAQWSDAERRYWFENRVWLIEGTIDDSAYVGSLLQRNDIDWGGGGSLTYFVWVVREDVPRALAVIKADPRARKIWEATPPRG